jgi:hypothetical protein
MGWYKWSPRCEQVPAAVESLGYQPSGYLITAVSLAAGLIATGFSHY